jgi:acyl carrier protein
VTISSDTESTVPASLDAVSKDVVAWVADVLEEPGTSSESNFLDLGGHSMLALELNSYATEKYGVEIDMQTLFEETLGEVAEKLVSARTEKNG